MDAIRFGLLALISFPTQALAGVAIGNPKIVEVGPESGTLPPVVLAVDRCDNEPPEILSLIPPPGETSAEAYVDKPACDAWVLPIIDDEPSWPDAKLLDLFDEDEQDAGPNRWALVSDAP